MITRTVSGIIGAIFAIAAIMFNQTFPLLLNILVSIVCILALSELFFAMGIQKNFVITIPSFILAILLPILEQGFIWQFSWYIYTAVIFSIMLALYNKITFKDFAVVYSMTILLILSLSCIVDIRNYGSAKYGSFYVITGLAAAWMSDTGAYFIGSFFGKHKLCPKISPKKTIEGALGGIIISGLSLVLVCLIFNSWVFSVPVKVNYISLIVMAVISSILSIIGDLSFSLIKRGCHIKDFGNVIPGHGGILDRFDSVIFVVPFIYFYIQVFPIIGA